MSSEQQLTDDVQTTILYQCGLLLCAVIYGAHIILFALSLRLTLRRRNTRLLAYVVVLFCVATIGFGLQAWWTLVAFTENNNYPDGPNKFLLDNIHSPANQAVTAVYIVLNMLSDGIILHRFYTLCGCMNARHRLWALLFVIPSSIALIITAGTCFPQITGLGVALWTGMSLTPGIAYMALSLSINTVLTLLIVGRLLHLRRQINTMFKGHGGAYTSAVALLIESAALYTTVALMTVIACGVGSPMQYVLLPMLGQLQAIPPLLITSRLAVGAALDGEGISRLRAGPGLRHKASNALRNAYGLFFDRPLHLDTSVPRTTSDPSALSDISYASEKSDVSENEKGFCGSGYVGGRMRVGSDASGASGVSEIKRMSDANEKGLPTFRVIDSEFGAVFYGETEVPVPKPAYGLESV